MGPIAHLWAIGYDSEGRADEVRHEIIEIGWGTGGPVDGLILDDVAVLVRHSDGTFSFDRDRHRAASTILGCTVLGLLAGMVMAAPLTGATVGALLGGAGSAAASYLAIDEGFIREVQGLMRPGTSSLLVLDGGGDMETILHHIRGLGGTVLKTNVDRERARLIQATLSGTSAGTAGADAR
jgi:uncharacterized membrane protein